MNASLPGRRVAGPGARTQHIRHLDDVVLALEYYGFGGPLSNHARLAVPADSQASL